MQYQRGRDNRWRFEFEAKGQRYTGSGFETKREARDAEMAKRRAVATSPTSDSKSLTLADYVELWLSDHVKVHCRPRTVVEYRRSLERHVLTRLGSRALSSITRVQLRELLSELVLAGLSRNTVKNVLIPLRACLNCAVDDGLLDENPATHLGRRVRARTEREAAKVKVFSKAQLGTILQCCDDETVAFDRLVHLLGRSGLRLGEALGLKQEDLDPEGRIHVRRSLQWHRGGCMEYAPKGGRERTIDVPRDLVTFLAGPGPYVIGGAAPRRPEALRDAWRELLKSTHLPGLRLHGLRHTYASLLLAAGAPLVYVRDQLGHASIQITADTYGHLIPGDNRAWVDKAMPGPGEMTRCHRCGRIVQECECPRGFKD